MPLIRMLNKVLDEGHFYASRVAPRRVQRGLRLLPALNQCWIGSLSLSSPHLNNLCWSINPPPMPTPMRPTEQVDDALLSRSLIAAFPARLLDSAHTCLPSLASLLRLYFPALSAEDLYYKTEAILMQDKKQVITQDVIDQLKGQLQREWESKARLTSAQQTRPFATPANKPRSGIGSL